MMMFYVTPVAFGVGRVLPRKVMPAVGALPGDEALGKIWDGRLEIRHARE